MLGSLMEDTYNFMDVPYLHSYPHYPHSEIVKQLLAEDGLFKDEN
jgi:hypothetical protein